MTTLFVPGFMADHTLWDDVIKEMNTNDVLFSDPSKGTSIEEMAELTLAHAPKQFDLVGFSMGGYIARAMVRMAPTRVKRLVLVATSARGDTEEQMSRKAAAIEFISATDSFRGLSRFSITGSLHPSRANDDAMISRIHAMSMRIGRSAFIQQSSLVRNSDLATLGEITCPTLILSGSHDRIRSQSEAVELHRGILGSGLIEIEGCGHMLPIEAPNTVGAAIKIFFANN